MQNLTIAIIIVANIITDIIKCSIFLVLINRYVIAAHTEPLTVAHKSIIGKPCSDRIKENTNPFPNPQTNLIPYPPYTDPASQAHKTL